MIGAKKKRKIFIKCINLNSFMAADNNLWQKLLFTCRRINFERKMELTREHYCTIIFYDFKVGLDQEECL